MYGRMLSSAPEARGVRGRRCPSAWSYVADAVIAACTSVTSWSTIGLSVHGAHDGCAWRAVGLALLRGGAPQPGGALRTKGAGQGMKGGGGANHH